VILERISFNILRAPNAVFVRGKRRFNMTHLVKSLGNATPHGTYALTVDGTGIIVGVGGPTAVGEITYDGIGHEHAQYTASVNGTIYKGVTVTGVYTVNPDCTGSLTESDGSHYDMVIAPDGSTVY